VNLAITVLFVAFALNLFGVYELRLPVRMLSRLDGCRAGAARHARHVTDGADLHHHLAHVHGGVPRHVAGGGGAGSMAASVAGLFAYSATFALPFVALARRRSS
jgi:hypothetical protein